MVTRREFVVERGESRVDLFLAREGVDLTRSQARRLIGEGYVLLNGSIPKPSQKLGPGRPGFSYDTSTKTIRACAAGHAAQHRPTRTKNYW